AMDVAVSSVALHAAHHHLDGEHYPHLRRLAFTYSWTTLDGSWLGHPARIRIRGNGRCNHLIASPYTIPRAPLSKGSVGLRPLRHHANVVSHGFPAYCFFRNRSIHWEATLW